MSETVAPFSRSSQQEFAPEALDEAYDRLRRRIEATKAIRFRSHERLIRRHKLSSYVVAMLSIYVIAISLVPTFFELNQRQNYVLLACTIVLSSFIIVLVLNEGHESFYHQAHVLHDSARKIGRVAFTLSNLDKRSPQFLEEFKQVAKTYDDLLQECPLNHGECDYHWVRSRYPELFGFHPPPTPKSRTQTIARIFSKSRNWIQAIAAEYIWILMPALFSLFACYIIYSVVSGWLRRMP